MPLFPVPRGSRTQSKPKPEDRRNRPSVSASSPCNRTRHGPVIDGSQSTSSPVHYVHNAFKHLPFPLVYSLVGVSYSHLIYPCVSTGSSVHLSICVFLCVCGVLWNLLDNEDLRRQMDVSQHWMIIWQLEYAAHYFTDPPNWKAREGWNAEEGSAVCLAHLGH